MGIVERTVNRAIQDVRTANAITAEEAARKERAVLANAVIHDGSQLSTEAQIIVAEILMAASAPYFTDANRGREVARLYAELKALFDVAE